MTPLRLRRESCRLQKFLVTNRKRFPSWVSLRIVYTCQDHVLESLKMAFFVVILDSKYSKMTPKFVKQKSQWLHSSIKFANPVIFSSFNLHNTIGNIAVHETKIQSVPIIPRLCINTHNISCMSNKVFIRHRRSENFLFTTLNSPANV